MRACAIAAIAAVVSLSPPPAAAEKLTFEERVELTRGLMAEYGTVKVLLPRSKKALEFDAANKTFDKKEWAAVAKEALAMVFKGADASGFEEDARLTAMWLWTLMGGTPVEPSNDQEEVEDDAFPVALR